MIKNYYKNNYILFSVNNFKKTLLNYYKISSIFSKTNLNYFSLKNNTYFVLSFELKDYFFEKENFINFLNEDSYYYNIILVKYANKFCSVNHFENIIKDNDIFLYENFVFFLNVLILKKISYLKMFLFLNCYLYNNLNNSLKCLLFIKQHQN